MRFININKLKGSDEILSSYPHLKEAIVSFGFDRLIQKDDGSFVIVGSSPKPFAINIEDGRSSIFTSAHKPYCQAGQTPDHHNCSPWSGDKVGGQLLFEPGPNKDIGSTEIINWEEESRPPAKWLPVLLIFLLWRLLKK